MGVCGCTSRVLSMMPDQKLLTLSWRWFLAGGSDMVVVLFAHQGGQYCHYGLMLSRSLVIIQDARPEIGDALVTLISRIGQRACRLLFHIQRQPITPLWTDVTMQPFDCWKDQTKVVDALLMLCWRSVDAHFGDIPTVIRCAIIVHDSHTVMIDCQYVLTILFGVGTLAGDRDLIWLADNSTAPTTRFSPLLRSSVRSMT